MKSLWQDVRYGWRGLYKQPGFAALAVLTLGLGIGAATTIFSFIHNVLFDPYPFPDVDRFVTVQIRDSSSSRPGGRNFFQVPEFLDLQEQNHVFEEVIGGTPEDVLQATAEGTEQFMGGAVTPNNFRFLGVPALMGRGLVPEDGKPGAPPVFVMSYKMWQGRYSGDPSVLGRTYVLNGVPTVCVGIMPQRFHKLAADLYRPIVLDRADPQVNRRFFMFQARLKRGVTTEQAAADLDVIVRRLAKTYPQFYPKQFTVRVIGWAESIVGQFQTTLYTLAAAVGLLLLIACSNVANMLLARGTAREREMAIRLSLGASRSRVVRQLLVESLLLASLGALVGCLFAYGGIKGIVLMLPEGRIPREAQITLNLPVLIFSMATAILTAVLFGLVPALHTARRDMVEPLKSSGKGVGGGFQRSWLRNSLVVAEVSLALVLLSGAGLLMRSFLNLQNADLGFNPEHVISARLPLPRGQYTTVADKQRFFDAALAKLRALPGVVSATVTTTLPPYGGIRSTIEIPGQPVVEQRQAIVQLVSDGYVRTLGMRLIRGRDLTSVDVVDGRRVAVINQTLADRFFKWADGSTGDPIGQRIKFTLLETPTGGNVENPVFEIVGVISDAKNQGLVDPIMPEALIPHTITGVFERGVLVRTATDPAAMVNSIRREIWGIDRNVAITDAGTLVNFLKRFSYAEPRLGLVLMGVFAGLGLLLVAVGVYSVIAYTVSRQTQEIGIRMALGARQVDVLGMVAGMGLRLIAVGLGIGLIASLLATRVLASQLFVTSPRDPITLAIAIGVMLVAGLAACYFPARRAIKVDPMVALRYE